MAPETATIVDAALRRAAAVEEADAVLIRHGMPSYRRVIAELALARAGFDTVIQVRALNAQRARHETSALALRTALRLGALEIEEAVWLADRGEFEAALDRLDTLIATMRRQAGPAREAARTGVIDFAAHQESRRFREITGDTL